MIQLWGIRQNYTVYRLKNYGYIEGVWYCHGGMWIHSSWMKGSVIKRLFSHSVEQVLYKVGVLFIYRTRNLAVVFSINYLIKNRRNSDVSCFCICGSSHSRSLRDMRSGGVREYLPFKIIAIRHWNPPPTHSNGTFSTLKVSPTIKRLFLGLP